MIKKNQISNPLKKLNCKIYVNKNILSTLKVLRNKVEKINKSKSIKSWITDQLIQKYEGNIKEIQSYLSIQILQDKVEQLFRNDRSQVFLKQPKFWARSITWVLMGSTAFAIGWIAIAKTDEVVIGVGKLEPKGGVVNVQMPSEGIVKEILVKEGEKVIRGQTLIKLDTEITKSQYDALQQNLSYNLLIKDKLERLVEEGAVPEIQYLEQKSKIEQIKSEIKTYSVRLKYKEISAPIDGFVFQLLPKGPGFVAQTSQPVLQVVPLDNLIAKVEVESRSIGYIKEGKPVEISVDSFPSTDFGVIEGKVSRIGSDALPPSPQEGKGYRFNVDIDLENQYLQVKSGKKLRLQTGMSLTANIKLRKVTYLKLLLNKFSNKAESLKSI